MPTKVKDVARHAVTTGEKVVKVSAKVATEEVKSSLTSSSIWQRRSAGAAQRGHPGAKEVAGKIQGRWMNRKVGGRGLVSIAQRRARHGKAIVEGQQKILTLRTRSSLPAGAEPEPEPTTMQKLMGIFREAEAEADKDPAPNRRSSRIWAASDNMCVMRRDEDARSLRGQSGRVLHAMSCS